MNFHKLVNFEEFLSPGEHSSAQVSCTYVSTISAHQMPLPWGMSPSLQNVKLTLCMTVNVKLMLCSTALDHQMPVLGGTSASVKMSSWPSAWLSMSSWPDIVLFLTTRCLYWGVHLHLCKCQADLHYCQGQADLTYCCSWPPDASTRGVCLTVHCILNCILQNVKMTIHSTALGHQMPLLGGTSHLKFWTHFRFGSCITEVFSTKDQQKSTLFIVFCNEGKASQSYSEGISVSQGYLGSGLKQPHGTSVLKCLSTFTTWSTNVLQ